jgi:hypothetical protein
MWQTVYLEARGRRPLASVHFTPDLAAAWRSWTRDWPSPRRAI